MRVPQEDMVMILEILWNTHEDVQDVGFLHPLNRKHTENAESTAKGL